MKKVLSMILILLLVLSLAACKTKQPDSPVPDDRDPAGTEVTANNEEQPDQNGTSVPEQNDPENSSNSENSDAPENSDTPENSDDPDDEEPLEADDEIVVVVGDGEGVGGF